MWLETVQKGSTASLGGSLPPCSPLLKASQGSPFSEGPEKKKGTYFPGLHRVGTTISLFQLTGGPCLVQGKGLSGSSARPNWPVPLRTRSLLLSLQVLCFTGSRPIFPFLF